MDRLPNSINLFPLYQTPRQALINHNRRELHQLLAVYPPEEVESSEGQDENLFVFVCQPPDNRPLSAMFPSGRTVNEDSSAIALAINDLVQAIQCAEQDKEWEEIEKEKGVVYWEWIGRGRETRDIRELGKIF
ncbi:hypothetical protein CRE_22994 [Caenorhabditis remanei]|uniref:Uncharacterized protein n=1 Tax=Caenorhabditis remanei TaxID=31234 RepID=E3N4D5_CAERE|nr:hypothetical protein CRE_22994 [Caenorhabditis remanei]